MVITDDREFIELRQEFRDFKERQQEANVDIKGRLTSIDASISAIAPLLIAHAERFKSVETTCSIQGKSNADRISRLEKGYLGALMAIAGLFLTSIWAYIFPPLR